MTHNFDSLNHCESIELPQTLQDQLDQATARLTSTLTSKDHPNG